MNDSKKPYWKSRTVLANAILGLAPLFPTVNEWIVQNPTAFGVAVAILNLGLRSVTGEPISFKLIDKKL